MTGRLRDPGRGTRCAPARRCCSSPLRSTVDFPKVAIGFQSDEATYYTLAHSLARDGDFTYERRDLVRVWESSLPARKGSS